MGASQKTETLCRLNTVECHQLLTVCCNFSLPDQINLVGHQQDGPVRPIVHTQEANQVLRDFEGRVFIDGKDHHEGIHQLLHSAADDLWTINQSNTYTKQLLQLIILL